MQRRSRRRHYRLASLRCRFSRRTRVSSGLAERIDRVRGDEPFEHWVGHQLEAAVLERERVLGLVSSQQRDQIEAQDARLEEIRDRSEHEPRWLIVCNESAASRAALHGPTALPCAAPGYGSFG